MSVNIDEATEKVAEYLSEAESLLAISYKEGTDRQWGLFTRVKNFVRLMFPDADKRIKDFRLPATVEIGGREKTEAQKQEVYIAKVKVIRDHLLAYKEELDLRSSSARTEEIENLEQDVRWLNNLYSRFSTIARQLGRRHGNRETLHVENEYDVQDLVHALLKLRFDDVRPEEWTPSYAGGHARMDFLLKEEGIVVETKMARKDLRDREVGNQLIVDIARYKEHPSCHVLSCFVYDPEGWISNPIGLEKDLSRKHDGLDVQVRVEPE